MATSTGFKQQCPSCEAMVPVKDVSLIGRKIDCPKCKYRFVVEEPDEAASEQPASDDTPPPTKKAGKKATADTATGANGEGDEAKTSAAITTKPKKRRRRGEDEEEPAAEEAPAKAEAPAKKTAKKKTGDKNSNKMMVGLALAGVGVVVLGFAAWLMFFKGKDKEPKKGGSTNNAGGNGSKDKKEDANKDKDKQKDNNKDKGQPRNTLTGSEITNLLLPKTDHVFHINFKEVWDTPLGKAIQARIPDEYFRQKTGLALSSVDEVFRTKSYRDRWVFNIVHTTEPINMTAVAEAMHLKPAKAAIKGNEYFVSDGEPPAWVNQLGRLSLSKKLPEGDNGPRKGALAVHKYDDQTLIFADETAMETLLNYDSRRPPRKAVPIDDKQPDNKDRPGPPKDMMPGKDRMPKDMMPGKDRMPKDMMPGKDRMPKDMMPGKDRMPNMPGDKGPPKDFKFPGADKGPPNKGLSAPAEVFQGGPPKDMKMPGKDMMPKDMKMPGRDMMPKDVMPGKDMIPKDMKMPGRDMMPRDMMPGRDKKPGKDKDSGKGEEKDPVQRTDESYMTVDPGLRKMLIRMDQRKDATEKVLFNSATLHEDAAGQLQQVWDITNWFATAPANVRVIGTSLVYKGEDTYIFSNRMRCKKDSAEGLHGELQSGIVPDFAKFFTDVTGIKLRVPKEEPKKKDGGNGGWRPPIGGGFRPPEGFKPPDGMRPPNFGPNGGKDKDKDKDKDDEEDKESTGIKLAQSGDAVTFRLTLALNRDDKARLQKVATLVLAGLKGEIDLDSGESMPHRLGEGVRQMTKQYQRFPQGAYPRRPAPERSMYPWEPDQRVSWMAQLLPYMGHKAVYDNIDFEKSWSDNDNLLASRTLIPEFLNPMYPKSSRYVNYPGMRYDVAATHFVGIAGLGEDAADESDQDPAAAGRLGIFGYDRPPLALDALQRGASNTALMIQVPPESASPWMAGGGSTVRGISETRSIDPFVGSGEKGTYVLMADGSVRFVAKDISPEAFKALCTIKGNGTMKDSEWQPVPPPKKGGMESRDKPPEKTEKPNPDKAKPPEKDKAKPPEKQEKPVGKPVGKPIVKPVGQPVKVPEPAKSK